MLLQVEKLGISFGGVRAVDGVDFSVEPGHVAAVIGPNGAGKTTLFNLIAGTLRPDRGRVLLGGEDVTRLPPHARAARGVARTFQATHLFEEATVLENAMVGTLLHTRSGLIEALLHTAGHRRENRESRDRARAALERVGVAQLADVAVRGISQEARKRVAIALALATEPQLLLLDEPGAGLTPTETARLGDVIRSLAETGPTVCLIEHKMKFVMSLANRILVLHHGQRIAEGPPAEVAADPAVVEAYLGGSEHARG
ncbi:MAG TPA: ABC transporter ATP-binding protein [Longimicrobiaceae bacterium]|nr:ABC transporter ATP-binding protein [Longimicrobiaceae bacterium]